MRSRCLFAALLALPLALLSLTRAAALPPVPAFNPSAPPLSRCRLAVIAAGMPRTGSTHVAKLALLSLGRYRGVKGVDAGYWNWAKHAGLNASATADYHTWQAEQFASWDESTVVLYKTHEYDPSVLRVCAQNVVLVSHPGCVESAVLSSLKAGFLEPNEDFIVGHLRLVTSDYFAWKAHASLDLTKESLRATPMHAAAAVHSTLGLALGSAWQWQGRDCAWLGAQRQEVAEESNPTIPHSDGGVALDALVKRVLTGPTVQNEIAADPRLALWRWTDCL